MEPTNNHNYSVRIRILCLKRYIAKYTFNIKSGSSDLNEILVFKKCLEYRILVDVFFKWNPFTFNSKVNIYRLAQRFIFYFLYSLIVIYREF